MVMKGFGRFISVALGLAGLVGIASCSDMEIPEIEAIGDNNESLEEEAASFHMFKKIAAGEKVTACYGMAHYQLFQNDERLGDKWEEVDFEDYCGWQSSLPYKINIIDSRVSLPYRMGDIVTGGSLLGWSWIIYCKVTDTHPELCIMSDMQVDEQNMTVTIGNLCCSIEAETPSGFRLIHDSSYWYHGNDGNVHQGTNREKFAYNQQPLDNAAQENIWIYESEYDLIVDLLSKFRATFGDEVDLNEYLYPNVILDDPIVNFNDLEAILLAAGH